MPVHQVKEFAPDLSFGGSASQPGLVALALTDNWGDFATAVHASGARIAIYYAAITSEGRGRVQAVPGLRDPARDVPAHRIATAHLLAQRSRPAWRC